MIKMQLLDYLTKVDREKDDGLLSAGGSRSNNHTITYVRAAAVMETSYRQTCKFVDEMKEQGLIDIDKNDVLGFKISITPKGVEIGQYLTQLNAMIAKLPKEFR